MEQKIKTLTLTDKSRLSQKNAKCKEVLSKTKEIEDIKKNSESIPYKENLTGFIQNVSKTGTYGFIQVDGRTSFLSCIRYKNYKIYENPFNERNDKSKITI